jgi:hypothetical protein
MFDFFLFLIISRALLTVGIHWILLGKSFKDLVDFMRKY